MFVKNPDGKILRFTLVDVNERNQLMETDAVKLYKVDKGLFNKEIHQLKGGDYLFLYTADAYALRFTSKEELDLFVNNKDHFTTAFLFDKNSNLFYYEFQLHNDKSIEMVKKIDSENLDYPSKTPALDFKLYHLKDGGYLRIWKRTENVYSASWFPDLKTFEWFYTNRYTT